MLLPAPKTDERTADKVIKESRALAPFYAAEWNAQATQGAGLALLQGFAQLLFDVIRHVNLTPEKNFVAFLDRLGAKLQPARPARAPVTFLLAPGTPESILIPARTQAAAEATETRPEVVFETERNLLATVAVLQAVYSARPSDDTIYEHLPELKNSGITQLFGGRNLQGHVFYLGHKELLMIKNAAQVNLKIISPQALTIQNLKDTNHVSWEYGLGIADETMQEQWYPFTAVSGEGDNLILTKSKDNQTGAISINQVENYWIRCRSKIALSTTSLLRSVTIDTVQLSVASISTSKLGIDLAFFNDVPLDHDGPFYPFGSQPRPFDTFYIASSDAFSKKGATVTLRFEVTMEPREDENLKPIFAWEYWNGTGWVILKLTQNDVDLFRKDGNSTVEFICPDDIATVSVNGQENFWVRVRIVGGSYGTFKVNNGNVEPDFKYPKVSSLTIAYKSQFGSPERCITYNNLSYQDLTQNAQTPGTPFQPFRPPEEDKPTFYLGFDKPLVGGPIGIYFSLFKQEYLEETKPRLQWQYWNGSAWVLLDVLDDTDNFTRSGSLQLVGPADFAGREKFGAQLFWIRAVDVDNRFQAPPQAVFALPSLSPGFPKFSRFPGFLRFPVGPFSGISGIFAGAESMTGEGPCPELLELFHPKFSVPAELSRIPPPPILEGVFLNTAWAIQAETIRDEILGSGDGQANQKFTLIRQPIFSEEIWVNEINVLLEEERKELLEQDPSQILEARDEKGKLTQVWVRWRSVEDFLDSTATSRHYAIDPVSGTIQFGDGAMGMIPPIGIDNIKATYQFGGGAKGNVGARKLTSLKTSVAGVDKVTNPEPAGGGADTETLAKALERGPQVIKHRNHAIAREDFEWLARQASSSIAKVKCLQATNRNGEFETGWVAVIIAPHSQEAQPLPSAELIRQVNRYLADRCPNVVSAAEKLIVTGPAYVEVSVTANVFAASIDLISQAQSETIKSLKGFLHPLTGGPTGEGWDFGRLVCLSDIIAMLEALPNVDHVDHVTMRLRDTVTNTTRTVTDDVLLSAALPSYALIFSGEHNVTVKFQAQT